MPSRNAVEESHELQKQTQSVLLARIAAIEKEVIALRQSNAALKKVVRGEERAPAASAAALRRAVDAAERAHGAVLGAQRRGARKQAPSPSAAPAEPRRGNAVAPHELPPLEAEAWLTSLGLNGIIASQLVSRLHVDVDADTDEDTADSWAASAPLPAESAAEVGARERAFFEALGGTTRESVMALLRDGPLEELLVDAIVDGCVGVAKEAAAR